MAPRANWKGYLRLSLVSCPIALYPASSLSEKVSFNRINRKTGNRLKQQNVDSETGDVVSREDIARGYEVGKGQYLPVEDEEIEAVEIESTRTIEIDQFVPRNEIDDRYIDSPYYIAPDGQVGQDAFAVIRDTIAKMSMVAIGRVVLTRREHIIALESRGRGLVGLTLRYPYEVRDEKLYFEDIPEVKLPKDMLDLATYVVQTKSGHFDPSQFEDRYENALVDLLKKKEAGGTPTLSVTKRTKLLIVGELGWPLLDDGRPSNKLNRAKDYGIPAVSERRFLEWIGKVVPDYVQKTHSAQQLAALSKMSPGLVLAALALLDPGHHPLAVDVGDP